MSKNTNPRDNFDKALKEAQRAIEEIHAYGPLPPVDGISESYDPAEHGKHIATVRHFLTHLGKLAADLRNEKS